MGNPGAANKSKQFRKGGVGVGVSSDLHVAARNGDLSTVESICNANPLAVNSRDRHSRTPLHLAAWAGRTEVVRFLCKNKADIGAAAMDDTAAIHFAAQKGHLEAVQILLSSGVSVKAANRKGYTPLHYAVQGSHPELIKYLIRKGASLTAKTKSGETPTDLASSEEICSLLEYKPPSVNDEKSTTSKTIAELDTKDSVHENNGESISNKAANIDEEISDVKEKRKGEEATNIDEGSTRSKRGRGHSNIQFTRKARTHICIGVARGLPFLHEEVKPHIVHRDVKASNILLDKNLTPKISDFGLARLLPPNVTHVSTRVAGTIGYLAPEYALRGQLTRRADIYSFGVLLLEIVIGRSNVNTRLPYEDQFLLERTWARRDTTDGRCFPV